MKKLFLPLVAIGLALAAATASAAGLLSPALIAGTLMLGMAGTVGPAAGTTFRVTGTAPGTFDATGYNTLFTASPAPALVGEITDFGDFGREYNLVKHNAVATRGTQKFKGSFDEGRMDLKIGLDTDDAGQIAMKTAKGSDNTYYFLITVGGSGDKYYFGAKVMQWKVGIGNVDNVVQASTSLEITTTAAGVGIVESLAA